MAVVLGAAMVVVSKPLVVVLARSQGRTRARRLRRPGEPLRSTAARPDGNAMVLARALAYIVFHGGDGLTGGSPSTAVLNANWLRHRLRASRRLRTACTGRVRPHGDVTEGSSTACAVSTGPPKRDSTSPGARSTSRLFVEEALMFEPTETEKLESRGVAEAVEHIAQPVATTRASHSACRVLTKPAPRGTHIPTEDGRPR